MDIVPVLLPESVLNTKLILVSVAGSELIQSSFPIFRMNMVCPCRIIEFYKFFYCISCNILNSSCPLDIPVPMVMFKHYLPCLFCSYSESFFALLKFFPGRSFLCDIFYHSGCHIHTAIFIFQVNSLILNIEVSPILSPEPVVLMEFTSMLHAIFVSIPDSREVFRMNHIHPAVSPDFLEFLITIPCNLRNCSCPVNSVFPVVIVIQKHFSHFCN